MLYGAYLSKSSTVDVDASVSKRVAVGQGPTVERRSGIHELRAPGPCTTRCSTFDHCPPLGNRLWRACASNRVVGSAGDCWFHFRVTSRGRIMPRHRVFIRHRPAHKVSDASDALLDNAGRESLARRLAAVGEWTQGARRNGAVTARGVDRRQGRARRSECDRCGGLRGSGADGVAQAVDDVRGWLRQFKRAEKGDFLRLWKALWYCMWHSDKPLVQQELAEVLAGLTREVAARSSVSQGLLYASAFFDLARMEWMKLDKWRVDKFRSLVRKMLSASLHVVSVDRAWGGGALSCWLEVVGEALRSPPDGIRMFLLDAMFEEVCRAAPFASTSQVRCVLQPVFLAAVRSTDGNPVVGAHAVDALGQFVSLAETVLEASKEEEGDPTEYPLHSLNFAALAWDLLTLGSSPKTPQRSRKPLYQLYLRLNAVAEKLGQSYVPPASLPESMRLSAGSATGREDPLADDEVDGVTCGAWPVVQVIEGLVAGVRPPKRDRDESSSSSSSSSSSTSSASSTAMATESPASGQVAHSKKKVKRTKDASSEAAPARAEAVVAEEEPAPTKKGKKNKKNKQQQVPVDAPEPSRGVAKGGSREEPSSKSGRRVRINSDVDALEHSESINRLRRSARLSTESTDAKPLKPVLKPSPLEKEPSGERRKKTKKNKRAGGGKA
jgi:ribosomal RNA-processing protein 1